MYLQIKAALIALVVVLGFGMAAAQTGGTGSILGSVKDSSGAVLRNAEVTITNTETGVESKAVTTSTGDYTVINLIPGNYQVTTQVSGFSKQVVNGITLTVDQQARVDVKLQPGGVSDVVEVAAGAVELDTDNSAISQLVNHQQIVDLPLNGRNFFDLLSLGAGAVTTHGEQSDMRAGKGSPFSINGARPEATTYFLDGMLNTDQALNTPSVILSIDAIQEFKVLSGTYSAQYGFGANQVSITSRAGTNSIHGSVFEFDRNDAFDALSYQALLKQKLRQNQFGAVAAGPVVIPFLYHGRDKTFWMANYEGIRVSTGGDNGFANVPLPSELAGNFAFAVKDPDTGQPFPGCNGYVSCIPASRFSRLAKVTLANGYIPAPNVGNCVPPACNGNLRLQSVGSNSGDQQTYRGDQNLGRWGSVFFRYTFDHFVTANYGGVSGVVGGKLFTERDHNWVGSHTISITPHLVNQFTFGRMEAYAVQSGTPVAQSVIDSLGFNGTFKTLTEAQRTYTNIAFTNNDQNTAGTRPDQNLTGFGGALNAYSYSDNPIWQFGDSVSYLRGAHSITLGGEYRPWHLVRDLATDFVGDITFSDYATGNQVGDFLLGKYSAAASYIPGPFSDPAVAGNPQDHIFRYAAAYAQDDWKVSGKFTANIGLRWDFRPVPYEARNHMFWLDASNAKGGLCYADVALGTDGVAPAGNGFYRYCGSKSPGSSEKKNFAPRIGGAYRIDEKTVLRGGYGLFWDGVEGREIDDSGDLYPYISRQQIQQQIGQASYAGTDSLFPVVSTPGPIVAGPSGPDSFIAVIISGSPKNPYVQDWSLSLEREVARNTTVEVNYIGTKGTHLLSRANINQALPLSSFPACVGNPALAQCTVNARRPYPNFATYLDSQWTAPSNYNAMNVKAEHRQGNTNITSIYTWAKSMDEHSAAAGAGNAATGWQGYLDNHRPSLDYGRSDFNIGQRFVTSFTYDLPVGRGKRLGGTMNKAADLVIGGWKTSGIITVQQGFPLDISANDTGGLLDSFGYNRADQHGPARNLKFSATPDAAVSAHNSALFSQPAFGAVGTAARNVATGPKYTNFDLGAKKAFAVTERVNFMFQLDGFNAINHSLHNGPCASPNCTVTVGSSQVPDFGYLTGAAAKRILQLSGKLTF